MSVLKDLIHLDKWANFHLLGGAHGETISSRCGRALKRAAAQQELAQDPSLILLAGVIESMPWFGPGHCVRNIQPAYDNAH